MTGCGESAVSKSPASRTGPIRSPRPKFEYKAGDKAAHGQYPTELEILPGDTVWIAFIGGDPHYSSITGSSSTPVESTSTKPMPSAEYEVKWTPEPSEPIVETYSHIPFAAVRISAEVEASGGGSEGGETRAGADAGAGGAEDTPTVTGYACTPSEALSGLEIVTGAEGVDVSAPNALPTAFPFLNLEYQIKRREYHYKTFEELAEEADEIISFKPDPSTQRDVSLLVTARLSDGTETSETFTLRLLQNFDSGKEQLKEAVNARRMS